MSWISSLKRGSAPRWVEMSERGAAPGGDGFGHAIEEALVRMERELVEFDVAALAGQSVRIRGEAIDTAAIGELEDVSGGVAGLVEDDLAQVARAEVEQI